MNFSLRLWAEKLAYKKIRYISKPVLELGSIYTIEVEKRREFLAISSI